MEILILVLIAMVCYLRFTIWQDNSERDEELAKLTELLDDVNIESPYKIEPKVVTKRKTKKRTVKKKAVKKVTPKKKVVKKRSKKK